LILRTFENADQKGVFKGKKMARLLVCGGKRYVKK
jgi:hypothetical protein